MIVWCTADRNFIFGSLTLNWGLGGRGGGGGLPIVGYTGSPGRKVVPFKARSILKGRENGHFSI